MGPLVVLLALLLGACVPRPQVRPPQAAAPATPAVSTAAAAVPLDWSCPAATATIVAVGDIRLDGPIAELSRAEGPGAPTAGVLPWLAGDVLVGNLETALTTRGKKARKKWNIRSPARALAVLERAGFDVLNLANNHVMDYGPEGLIDTVAALDARELLHVGAGKSLKAALEPVFVDVNGIRIGFMGLTQTLGGAEGHFAGGRRAGVAYGDLGRIGAWIGAAKAKCDVLLVSFHAGTELAPSPHSAQRAFGRAAIDAGADAVLAHHPHVLQPIELYRGKPILHSLGNFLFVSPTPSTRDTAIARLAVGPKGPCAIDFIPVDVNYGRLSPAGEEGAERARAALDRDGALSAHPQALRLIRPVP